MWQSREWSSRTEILLGSTGMERLAGARVAVFGIGGVGGHAVEAMVRSGIGAIDLIDHDRVSITNINRQAVAFHSTVGRLKVEVMKERVLDINPEVKVRAHNCFYLPETAEKFDFTEYDYVVDCIDTVTGKIQLIQAAKEAGTPIICSMGAGNKLDPTGFMVADISKTGVCPLAKVMRRELKKRGITKVKVVYSREEPVAHKLQTKEQQQALKSNHRKVLPGSCAFVPSVVGLILASEVVKDIAQYS